MQEQKRLNMSRFIGQLRNELMEIWRSQIFLEKPEMRFSHPNYATVTAFTEADFDSDLYTEELLEKFEKELEFWKQFSEKNRHLVDLV